MEISVAVPFNAIILCKVLLVSQFSSASLLQLVAAGCTHDVKCY